MSLSKKHIVFPVPCAYCQVPLTRETHTWDHITPSSKGGTDAQANLNHCCLPCNLRKADLFLQEFLAGQGRVRSRPIPRPPRQARHYPMLEELNGTLDYARRTFTPARGCGVSKTLRQVLRAKGISVTWLPLAELA